jgi:predicted RNA-binding Zn-ribbon protein involved in translation (DUF1610 family)
VVQYYEFECPACGESWEMFARAVVYGPDDYELVPVPDGPGFSGGSDKCPECGETGVRV